ncbi:hypothetical protein Pla108_18280 [Botrimarina colliarenosi]|uniref:DUF3826 domain-containing protein n=1 Tax=Botrimarina colliarenosi TaxID=2528001 RepID=A0A5C6AE31_9BACT|nr:DUF3826 domain-containing protein [Botrimarina colliarenosi]TWT97676.1 hypothetical protein Pla108_18280 [Botrimarina colliarenosi]
MWSSTYRRVGLVGLMGAAAWLCCDSRPAAADTPTPEDAYRQTVVSRASRIVEALELTNDAQRERVVTLIADHYVALHDAHAERDAAIESGASDKQAARDACSLVIVERHRHFVAALSAELPAEGVERVKDGMTYGVVPITYAAYQRLLPGLSPELKRMILANLLEAREYAMDGGSSKEKHGWFGKYKGRINNRLSAAGYDLKQAEHDLAARTE